MSCCMHKYIFFLRKWNHQTWYSNVFLLGVNKVLVHDLVLVLVLLVGRRRLRCTRKRSGTLRRLRIECLWRPLRSDTQAGPVPEVVIYGRSPSIVVYDVATCIDLGHGLEFTVDDYVRGVFQWVAKWISEIILSCQMETATVRVRSKPRKV